MLYIWCEDKCLQRIAPQYNMLVRATRQELRFFERNITLGRPEKFPSTVGVGIFLRVTIGQMDSDASLPYEVVVYVFIMQKWGPWLLFGWPQEQYHEKISSKLQSKSRLTTQLRKSDTWLFTIVQWMLYIDIKGHDVNVEVTNLIFNKLY